MKCISLWQPWATLVVIGAKRIETRSWSTKYRGPIAIHAAKNWNQTLINMCGEDFFRKTLGPLCVDAGYCSYSREALEHILPRGCVLGTVELTDCADIVAMNRVSIGRQELAFGDFADGRYAWSLSEPRQFVQPVPCVGRQGIFNIEESMTHHAYVGAPDE